MSEQLGSAVLDLAVDNRQLKAGLADAERQTDGTFKSLGSKVKSAGATLTKTLTPIAAALGVAFKQFFDDFDAGADGIRVATGKTGAELDGLVESMKKVGGQVTQPLAEVGKVMGDLARRTGLTGKPLETLTKQILDLSRITGTDAQTNVANLTRLYGDWSIKTEHQAQTNDKLFRASQASGIGIDRLSELMVQFGSPLRAMGLDFDTTAAMFARFEKEGVNIQTAMPGLKQALGNFAIAGREPAKALQQTIEKIKETKNVGDALGFAAEIFGKRAGPDLAMAIREGRFDLDEYIGAMKNGSDTIAKATSDTNSWGDKLSMLRNRVAGIVGPFGEMGAAIMGGIATIGPALFGLGTVMDSTVGKTIVGWAKSAAGAVKAAATHVLQVGRQIVAWALLGVQALIHAAKVALAWLIAMGPIALVVAAVIALVALVILNFDKIKEFIGNAWTWIKEKTANVWNGIKEFVGNLWNGIKEKASNIFNNIKEFFANVWNAIRDKARAVWDGIRDFFDNIWESIKNKVHDVWNGIKGWLGDAWSAIKETAKEKFQALKDGVVDKLRALVDFVKDIPKRIVNAIGDLGQLLYKAGRAVITGLLDGIKSALGAVWETVSGIAGKIASLKGPLTKDRKLLIPAGRAIMAGLEDSMKIGFRADVAPMLAAITASIGSAGSGEGRTVHMGGVNQTIYGVLPGDVQRETQRALRRAALSWELE